ncbi:hypothetical protein GR160_15635 [Flavobacterium sp. Sd200]|uniref:hypothetical protein n=1 Tax=Flavobacterium sp. Sd200 TaxID=2692211 RepID=UPI00137086A9|nr:hypothetical protein [Flavobacterium sp. Sd200]MXN92660.1 hypothetical protein [Flavobacterium sp. Sd200]
MNAVSEVIGLMNLSDKKDFENYIKQKNKRNDTQNLKLFRLLETDDINTINKIYGTNNAAYHALNKRLYDNLVSFMANRTFVNATGEAHEVLRLLVVSRFFLEHKLTKAAFKCLAKAEAKANDLGHFSLLNEIYHTQIQFSHLEPLVNLEALIEKFTANAANMQKEEKLNMAYALLRNELADVMYKGKVIVFKDLIKSTLKRLTISLKDVLTFKSLYQMLYIANEYASLNSNFAMIEPFVQKSYSFIAARQDTAGNQLYYHIYILYFMANIHFRNRRFAESEAVLQTMHEQMREQNGRYYSLFCLRYFLILSLTKNYGGYPIEALSIAQKALKDHGNKADASDVHDIRLAIIVFCLLQEDRTVSQYMKDYKHTDSWYEKKLGMLYAIRRCLVEILMHIQFENTELALSRIKSFKRRYKKYLNNVNEARVMDYVLLLEHYVLKPEITATTRFKQALEALLHTPAQEDIFVLSFIGWLKARFTKKTPYDETLILMNS